MTGSTKTQVRVCLGLAAAAALVLSACSSGQTSTASSSAAAPAASASTSAGGASAGSSNSAAAGGSSAAGSQSAAPAAGPVRIAYLQKQGDQQYFVDQANGAKAKAGELGADITVVNLGDDANKAISELDTVLAQGYNAIAIVVPDQKIGPQVIEKAKAAGVALVASDDIIKDSSGAAAPFVGFDGAAMGEKVGTEAGTLFKNAGWNPAETAILRVSKEDLSVCEDRVDAATAAFVKAAGTDQVKVLKVGTDASVIDSQNKSAAIITANPDVKNWVVYGCNDESETGAVTALANAGFGADNVIGVGLGAYLTCKDWVAGSPTGNKAALFISGTEVGQSAVQVLFDSVSQGQPLPPTTIAKTVMVNPENFKQEGVVCT